MQSSGATLTTDKSDYPPGSVVDIFGANWQPGETVRITIHEDPPAYPDPVYSVVADSVGGFINMSFSPTLSDVGRTFTVTAVGQLSGFVAQTTFTDAGDATDGSGSMTVSPASVIAGTIGNTLTFTFAGPSGKDFNAGSQATILVPAGWTAPTSGNVVVATGPVPACAAATLGTITGTGPWTIPIDMRPSSQ